MSGTFRVVRNPDEESSRPYQSMVVESEAARDYR